MAYTLSMIADDTDAIPRRQAASELASVNRRILCRSQSLSPNQSLKVRLLLSSRHRTVIVLHRSTLHVSLPMRRIIRLLERHLYLALSALEDLGVIQGHGCFQFRLPLLWFCHCCYLHQSHDEVCGILEGIVQTLAAV